MKSAAPTAIVAFGMALAAILMLSPDKSSRAHEGATGIVADRMEMMKSMGNAMKRLASMYRGEAPYDPAEVREAAAVIGRLSGEHLTEMFPPGSHDHPSEALPKIWDDWHRFSELAEELAAEAGALAEIAAQGQTGADAGASPSRGAFARLGRVCSACHTEFRKEE